MEVSMKVRSRAPHMRPLAAVAAIAALSLTAAACGDDDEGSTTAGDDTASAEEVTLTANDVNAPDEYTFDLSATPTAETKSVTFTNEGSEPHFLAFARINEGYTLDEVVKAQGKKGTADIIIEQEGAPGSTTTVPIKKTLEPGEYFMLCPIPGPNGPHYKNGQLEEFTIE
jgi:hypothetical protein